MHRLKPTLFILLILQMWSCKQSTTQDALLGKWTYEQITQEGVSIMDLDRNDYFILTEDDSFSYALHQADRYGKGTWKFVKPQELHLHYTEPIDTVRVFTLKIAGAKKLVFEENKTLFSFYK
jgi:hypothetical protein